MRDDTELETMIDVVDVRTVTVPLVSVHIHRYRRGTRRWWTCQVAGCGATKIH